MNGLTDYITQWPWVSIVTTWFVLVDDAYRRLVVKRGCPFRASGPEPAFSDSEAIPVSLNQRQPFNNYCVAASACCEWCDELS